MHSTDYNINAPLKKLEIELQRRVSSWKFPTHILVTEEEYNLMKIHDPHTIYHIKDSNTDRSYYGDILIQGESFNIKYLMSIDDNKYIIYTNVLAGTSSKADLIPLCIYDDPQIAINKLSEFNRIGSHYKIDLDIYNMIVNYINKDISTHDLIIGILVTFGYREDPRLQNAIQFIVGHGGNKCMKEFPPVLVDQITRMRDLYPDSLYPFYSNLYDLIVKYDFFMDVKYKEDGINLSKEISEISKIITESYI